MSYLVHLVDEETGEYVEVGLSDAQLALTRSLLWSGRAHVADTAPGPLLAGVTSLIEGIQRLE